MHSNSQIKNVKNRQLKFQMLFVYVPIEIYNKNLNVYINVLITVTGAYSLRKYVDLTRNII